MKANIRKVLTPAVIAFFLVVSGLMIFEPHLLTSYAFMVGGDVPAAGVEVAKDPNCPGQTSEEACTNARCKWIKMCMQTHGFPNVICQGDDQATCEVSSPCTWEEAEDQCTGPEGCEQRVGELTCNGSPCIFHTECVIPPVEW